MSLIDWCKLYARYPDDPAIQRAGEAAEVLFIRSLAYCAQAESDGHIPTTQLPRFGLPRDKARVAALVRYNLWTEVDDGWVVTRWGDLQKTTERIERRRKADRERQARRRDTDRDTDRESRRDTAQSHGDRVRERIYPLTPTDVGGCAKHETDHPNCRGCGTNSRSVRAKAKADAIPPLCGECSPGRMIELDDDTVTRCPRCHPGLVSVSA